MKKFELIIASLLIPLDILMLYLAAITAYFLRFDQLITQFRPVVIGLDFSTYLQSAIPLVLLWITIFAFAGLYTIQHPRRILTEIKKIFVAVTLGFAAITILVFLRGELFNSRFIVLAATILAFFFVTIARLLIRWIKFAFYKRGIGVRRVILVGNDKNAVGVTQFIKTHPRHGLQVVKRLHNVNAETMDKLQEQMKRLQPDLVLQASVNQTRDQSEVLLDFAYQNHIQFAYVADLFNTKLSNAEIETYGDIPVVEIKQTPLDGWGRIAKRSFDIIVGGTLALIFSPLMLLIAIAIRMESRGPVIYKNERVGKGGELFKLYKFRRFKAEYNTGSGYDKSGKALELENSLISKQSERRGPIYKVIDDPRNTRIGAFLEKTSLDELPQFFNVLNGEISLVGPRPHQEREVEGYRKEHRRVFVSKPGITGLAQISGRSDLDYDEEARLDILYVENWSLKTDLAILLKTPFALLRRHK